MSITLKITKNQHALLMGQKAASDAALRELKSIQVAMVQSQAAYEAANMSLNSVINCLSLDGTDGEASCQIGTDVRFEEKDGEYLLTITPPLEVATASAG